MQLSSKMRSISPGSVSFYCPGCEGIHGLNVNPDAGRPCWGYNGNPDAPTFTPSILVTLHDPDGEIPDEVCHSFVTDGMVQFLGDCTHALAGQTVPLPDLPEAYRDPT